MKARLVLTMTWAFAMGVSTLVFADANPVGRWEGSTPQGSMAVTISKGDDGALTGEMEADQLGLVPLDEVALDGNTLTWSVEIDMGGQLLNLSYEGAIDGDKIDGTVDAAEFGMFPIPLTRAGADVGGGGLLGEWDLNYEIQGNAVTAKLVLAKGDSGAYSGTWDSQFGKSDLKDVAVDGNSATFSRSISAQGQDMDITYSAKAQGDAITGTIAIPQLGDVPFTGKRAGAKTMVATHLGTWNLEVDAQGQVFPIELTVTETDDGALAVNTSTQRGQSEGSDVSFEDGTLTFVVVSSAGGGEMSFAYTLDVEGDSIEGTIASDFGDMPVTGTRAPE